jgi:hypothetical protein
VISAQADRLAHRSSSTLHLLELELPEQRRGDLEWPSPDGACAFFASFAGAPISSLIAAARSSRRRVKTSTIRSSSATPVARRLREHLERAARLRPPGRRQPCCRARSGRDAFGRRVDHVEQVLDRGRDPGRRCRTFGNRACRDSFDVLC